MEDNASVVSMTSLPNWETNTGYFDLECNNTERDDGHLLATAVRSHIDERYPSHLKIILIAITRVSSENQPVICGTGDVVSKFKDTASDRERGGWREREGGGERERGGRERDRERQAGRQADKQTEREGQAGRQASRQTDRQTKRDSDRQTNKHRGGSLW